MMTVVAVGLSACKIHPAERSAQASLEPRNLDFGIFWPPKDPSEVPTTSNKVLLQGRLSVHMEPQPDHGLATHVRIVLTRPSDEASRASWNARLGFPEYDWMRYVRVWDAENRWLWPNLPYLLRLHGTERVERYGGVDPGKGVDNDFAAVLIRKYAATGTIENDDTKNAPLVAGEWYPVVAMAATNRQTIVHAAQSDEFILHTGSPGKGTQGTAIVWLIYADFMAAKLPDAWPKTPEYAGGILACFELKWDMKAPRGNEITVRQIVPPQATGFDWERWVTLTRATRQPNATARLSDEGATDNRKFAPVK